MSIEKRTVLFVSHSSELYGSRRSLLTLVTGLQQRGAFRPVVLLPRERPLGTAVWKPDSVRLLCLLAQLRSALVYWALAWLFQRELVRAVLQLVPRHIGAAQRGGLKHVVTFYGHDVTPLPNIDARWRDRYAQLQADRILFEGSHMAKEIQRLAWPPDKIRVHHLGVQVDRLDFRPRIYRPREALCVLIAASFREKKGIPYALQALGRLQDEIPIAVTIIGGANDEARNINEKARILGVIDNFNLGPKVRMLGYQPHEVLFRAAYDHHVFLSPSVTASDGDTEGGAPVSIIELAATGIPIISTRHCDIPEVIQNGVTGMLAEEKDVEGLLIHLEALIANPKGWEPMLRASRQHIQLEYDAGVQAERLARIYRELVCR